MSLNIGIIGLPNVGKSTTFNALTEAQNAEVANYPFCTIQANKAIVPVPDKRLDKLHKIVGVPNQINATIEFIDIAGLVRGASQGEGLGNQFLGNIRDADAIVHVVRCFDDPNVVHINPQPEPRADIEIVNTELIFADLQQLEKKIERLERQVKGDKKQFGPVLDLALDLKGFLESGRAIKNYPQIHEVVFQQFNKEMRFLTAKPLIYVANIDEDTLQDDNDYVKEVRLVASEENVEVIKICAKLEEELVGLTAEEREEYLALSGITESGLSQLIRLGYQILGLISFFTMNENEVRAWNAANGATAPQAAGVIHTDFERGFIRAEVIDVQIFFTHGSMAAAKSAGALRVEGRDYVVQDGDLIYFRFNV